MIDAKQNGNYEYFIGLRRRPETLIIIFLRTFDAWGGGVKVPGRKKLIIDILTNK